MQEIHKVVGGSMLFNKGQNGLKPHYRITLYCNQAYDCLKLMLPYLIVKKKEAEIAIKYQESLRTYGSGMRLTDAETDFQEKYHLMIKLMHGGKIVTTN